MEINEHDFVRLTTFLKAKFGLNLINKKQLVEGRLGFYVTEKGFKNYSDFLNYIFADKTGVELANVVDKLTTNHTYFMREQEHFNHLLESFLPEAEQKISDRDLRIWSAGCSFGNEPYNIVMCLLQYLGTKRYNWDCKILATDISFNALRVARLGIYRPDAMECLPDKWVDRYFKKLSDGSYQVSNQVRENVVFKYHNLMDEIKFKKDFDLIFCRNVMIYFDDADKNALTERFYDASAQGAYLYIGHTESLSADTRYTKVQPAIYTKE